MHRGGAPRGVEDGPAEIHDGPVAERAVKLDRAEGHVRCQAGDSAKSEELYGPVSHPPRREQPCEQREQENVAKRVGDRDELLQPGQFRVMHVWPDQERPRQQREPGREGQRVDHAALVLVRGPQVDEGQQADGVQRKGRQVKHVREGRKRKDHLELRRDQEAELARREAGKPGGQPQPWRLAGGPAEH